MLTLPLLTNTDRCFWPADGFCPICGKAFADGFAYLSAGSLQLDQSGDSVNTEQLQAFFNIGFHSRSDADMKGSADIGIVNNLAGGQFDLQWCSIACMTQWLLQLLEKLEREAKNSRRVAG